MIPEWLNESILVLPGYLVDANKRIYAWYLVSAIVLALPAYLAQKRQLSVPKFARYLFHPKIWGHPSARLDYVLFVTNRVVKALLWAPLVLTMVPIALGFSDILEQVFGKLSPFAPGDTIVIGVFTLVLFLFDDLTRFLLHLALHKIPFLWDFHKVHHSAKVMTPMTIYRSHPFESYLYACRMALAQGMAVGTCYYFFGPTLSMFDVFGANLFVFAFNIMGSNLRHSHVWWSWGNRIEKWFISPAQHQVHHSVNPAHFDRNLGSALAIWDRLCGTLVLSKSVVEKVRFGINAKHQGQTHVIDAYCSPFVDIWRRLFPKSQQVTKQ